MASFSQISFPWQRKNSINFLPVFDIYQWSSISDVKFRDPDIVELCLKCTAKPGNCPKNSQLCCVMMTKQIFKIWYLYFIPCLFGYNVLWWYSMHSLRNICDLDIFVCTSCNHGNEKYITSNQALYNVGHDTVKFWTVWWWSQPHWL